jgi:hypothetical protein
MDAVALLEEANQAGLTLTVEGDTLQVRGPKTAAPVVERLRAHNPLVMAYLTRPAVHVWSAPLGAYVWVLAEAGEEGTDRMRRVRLHNGVVVWV